jgi:cysteinyl-tRNA synthetase
LFELAKPLRGLANRIERGDASAQGELEQASHQQQLALLLELAEVVGLKHEGAESSASGGGPSDAEIEAQIEARKAAKAAKDFAAADRIRDELKAQGIELIDKPGGLTEWLRA